MKHFLTIDGQRTDEYGVSISGVGTFNAPSRDMEAVAIPGKNGHMLLDNGRYENISVTYPAFMGGGFDSKIEAFRAFLLSDPGYRRLEDSYHPDEFRLGAYRGGFEAKTGVLNRAANFDLAFDCKPQRFLKTGDEWGPPYMLGGSGVQLIDGGVDTDFLWISSPTFAWNTGSITLKAIPEAGHTLSELETLLGDTSGKYAAYAREGNTTITTSLIRQNLVTLGEMSFQAASNTVWFSIKQVGGFRYTLTVNDIEYRFEKRINLYNPTLYEAAPIISVNIGRGGTFIPRFTVSGTIVEFDALTPYRQLYIDSELGDCYATDNVTPENANQYISLTKDGAITYEFPRLKPGRNIIEFAMTEWNSADPVGVAIKPRWWTL